MADRGKLTYEEAEANRSDPSYGDPVRDLALHAMHWVEVAEVLHPDLETEIKPLFKRLSLATGGRVPDDYLCDFPTTDGEIVLALEEIVQIMKQVAPLLRKPEQ